MASLRALAEILVLYSAQMSGVEVLRHDLRREGDAVVLVTRDQEDPAGHDVVRQQRRCFPQIHEVHVPPGGSFELSLELVECAKIRGLRDEYP
jgi:hypothetical protein